MIMNPYRRELTRRAERWMLLGILLTMCLAMLLSAWQARHETTLTTAQLRAGVTAHPEARR